MSYNPTLCEALGELMSRQSTAEDAKTLRFAIDAIASQDDEPGDARVVALPAEPTPQMVAAMAACYDPTWGYPDRSVADKWARESYAVFRALVAGAPSEGARPAECDHDWKYDEIELHRAISEKKPLPMSKCSKCGVTQYEHLLGRGPAADRASSPAVMVQSPQAPDVKPGERSQDAIDAARYRWLRRRNHIIVELARQFHNDMLDDAIDKAMGEPSPVEIPPLPREPSGSGDGGGNTVNYRGPRT